MDSLSYMIPRENLQASYEEVDIQPLSAEIINERLSAAGYSNLAAGNYYDHDTFTALVDTEDKAEGQDYWFFINKFQITHRVETQVAGEGRNLGFSMLRWTYEPYSQHELMESASSWEEDRRDLLSTTHIQD